jgi:hypothetical protein
MVVGPRDPEGLRSLVADRVVEVEVGGAVPLGRVADQRPHPVETIRPELAQLGVVRDQERDAAGPALVREAGDAPPRLDPARPVVEPEIVVGPVLPASGQAGQDVEPPGQPHVGVRAALQERERPGGRHRLGVVDEVVEDDDLRIVAGALGQEVRHLHGGVVVADPGVDDLHLPAAPAQRPLQALGHGLLHGHAPAEGDGVAEHEHALHTGRPLVRILGVAQLPLVDPDVDAHEAGGRARPMLVAEHAIGRHLLHRARVLPHLQVELQAVVDDEPHEGLEPAHDQDDGQQHGEAGEEDVTHGGRPASP